MASTGKRNRNVLSVEEKVTIISRLEKGETGVSLAKIFNVGKATISDIKSRKSEILRFASQLNSENGSKKRKTMKKASDEKLENAVYLWFMQQRSQGKPISGPLICEKALQLNQKLEGPSEFKASTGWLKNFKSRHGIRELEIQEASSNVRTADAFKESFLKMVAEEGFSKDDVYSADETSLNWKSLPCKSLALRREMAAPDFKAKKRCVTVMVCANASGQHALPLLVIGKSESPRCFKGITCLPVRYKAQKYAWVDSNIFLDWFSQDFIPNVKRQRENDGKTGKVLLIIDSAPSHPSLEKLNSFDDNFIVRILPPNVTALLQPMGCGVIEKLKNMYKIQVLRRLLISDGDEESVVEFSKKLNIKDCCYMVADAWNMLSEGDLQRAWHKLWGAAEETVIHVQDVNEDIDEIVSLFHKIPGFSECGQDEAEAWLNTDLGYHILTEEEIVASVQDVELTDIHQGDYDAEEEEAGNRSTHTEAFHALETALAWCERQSECSSMDILLLKRMRDLAAKKKTISHGSKKN